MTRRFTLIEFNEDAVVIDPGTMTLLGVADDWFKHDHSLDHHLLSALGWRYEPLDKWKAGVIGAAMRQQRYAVEYANGSPVSVGPGRLFELAIEGLPLLFHWLAPLAPGVIVDGASLLDDSLHIVQLAERYGFIAFLDGEVANRDNSIDVVDEAIAYLQTTHPHLTFDWSDAESGVLLAEEAA